MVPGAGGGRRVVRWRFFFGVSREYGFRVLGAHPHYAMPSPFAERVCTDNKRSVPGFRRVSGLIV